MQPNDQAIYQFLCSESVAEFTTTGTEAVRSSSDDDEYSAEILAVAIGATFILTAVIVGVFVIMVALLISTYHKQKAQKKLSSVRNGVDNPYELPEKT